MTSYSKTDQKRIKACQNRYIKLYPVLKDLLETLEALPDDIKQSMNDLLELIYHGPYHKYGPLGGVKAKENEWTLFSSGYGLRADDKYKLRQDYIQRIRKLVEMYETASKKLFSCRINCTWTISDKSFLIPRAIAFEAYNFTHDRLKETFGQQRQRVFDLIKLFENQNELRELLTAKLDQLKDRYRLQIEEQEAKLKVEYESQLADIRNEWENKRKPYKHLIVKVKRVKGESSNL